jgi:5-methylcytosine-specific restriction endonuclease McrA
MRAWQREYDKSPKVREWRRGWDKSPKVREYFREHQQRRQAAKRSASPPWLAEHQVEAMRAIHKEAARLTEETGIPHHVDHVVPLTHPDVQGLHVPWNLQVLRFDDNIRKSNAFDYTNENESWRAS